MPISEEHVRVIFRMDGEPTGYSPLWSFGGVLLLPFRMMGRQ